MYDIDAIALVLAQGEPSPPAPGEAAGSSNGAAGNGQPLQGADGGGGSPGPARDPGAGSEIFIIMLVLFGVMIVFSLMGQRRDRKKRQALINAVKKHDRVQTVGGVIGSIVEVKSDSVVLKVDEASNTRITFARSAIQQVLSSGRETAGDAES